MGKVHSEGSGQWGDNAAITTCVSDGTVAGGWVLSTDIASVSGGFLRAFGERSRFRRRRAREGSYRVSCLFVLRGLYERRRLKCGNVPSQILEDFEEGE